MAISAKVVAGGVVLGLLLLGSRGKKGSGAKAPPATPNADQPGPNPATPYLVRAGDSLVSIAEKTYGGRAGRPGAFAIFDRNPELTNPNAIRAGATLMIPTAAAYSALPASVLADYKARWDRYLALGTRDGRYFTNAMNPGDADPAITRRTPLPGTGVGFLAGLTPFGLGTGVRAESVIDPEINDAFL